MLRCFFVGWYFLKSLGDLRRLAVLAPSQDDMWTKLDTAEEGRGEEFYLLVISFFCNGKHIFPIIFKE
jgi:hypothetical protein